MLPTMQNFPVCIPSSLHYWFLNYIIVLLLFSKSVTVRTDTKSNQTVRKPSVLSSYSDGWWITSQPLVLFTVMKSSPGLRFLILKVLLWKNFTAEENTCFGMLRSRIRVQTITNYWSITSNLIERSTQAPTCFLILSHVCALFTNKPCKTFFSEIYRAIDTILSVSFHWTSYGCAQKS